MLHHSLKLKPTRMPTGELMLGVGRRIEDAGLTKDEAIYLLVNDISRARRDCLLAFPFFAMLGPIRQRVYIDLSFMGIGVFKGWQFTKMHEYVGRNDFERASVELLATEWAEQAGKRARRLAEMLRSNRDFTE